jgi:hypothetical protein
MSGVIYDQERDELSFEQQLQEGMAHHNVRLAAALEILLEPSASDDEGRARVTIARSTLDEYQAWFSDLQRRLSEQWHARFGGALREVH